MIHPLAHVDADVHLGAGTNVWQFASITRGAVLGAGCSVSPFAMLDGSIYGDRVIVSGGVKAGAGFKIGNDVFLGPNVVLCNDFWPFATKDGYHDDLLRDGEHFAVTIEDGAFIGANATVKPGIRIGRNAGVECGAVVGKHVPDGMLYRANGYISEIPADWQERRMRWATC